MHCIGLSTGAVLVRWHRAYVYSGKKQTTEQLQARSRLDRMGVALWERAIQTSGDGLRDLKRISTRWRPEILPPQVGQEVVVTETQGPTGELLWERFSRGALRTRLRLRIRKRQHP